MTKLLWDAPGERIYETGVDHGVLYRRDVAGAYSKGYPWLGLVSISESPSGAEANPQYADNIKYLNLVSAEEFGGTIEAFTYPKEFEPCDGTAEIAPGVTIGQQRRETFGLSYRTLVGNDLVGTDYGYKLHLVYGGLAAPTEKARSTVNDSPEAVTFSWELSTTPIEVPGFKPTAHIVVDSFSTPTSALKALEDILYGTDAAGAGTGTEARLPTPAELLEIFGSETPAGAQVASTFFSAPSETTED